MVITIGEGYEQLIIFSVKEMHFSQMVGGILVLLILSSILKFFLRFRTYYQQLLYNLNSCQGLQHVNDVKALMFTVNMKFFSIFFWLHLWIRQCVPKSSVENLFISLLPVVDHFSYLHVLIFLFGRQRFNKKLRPCMWILPSMYV